MHQHLREDLTSELIETEMELEEVQSDLIETPPHTDAWWLLYNETVELQTRIASLRLQLNDCPKPHPFWDWVVMPSRPEVDRIFMEGPDVVVEFVNGGFACHRLHSDADLARHIQCQITKGEDAAVHILPGIVASPVEAEVVQ